MQKPPWFCSIKNHFMHDLRLAAASACILGSLLCSACVHADGPLGLPVISDTLTENNDYQISLGKKLFFDKRLSAGGSISCASCHIPEKAFTDGLPVARGVGGQLGSRNTPSLFNVSYATSLFWDGRRATLEQQASDPLLNPREHGLKDRDVLLELIRRDENYLSLFQKSFAQDAPPTISIQHITLAIAAFERTLLAGDSPFDRYFYGNDKTALSDSAIHGLDLFRGRAQCAKCHTIGAYSALLADDDFHSLGIGFKKIEAQLVASTIRVADADAAQLDRMVIEEHGISELGRFVVTKQPRDIAKFKTPSLRNVALTAPYMHDGSIPTLAEAVELEIYYRGVEVNRPLILTALEKTDLIAFLESLTSPHAQKAASNLSE